MARQQLRDVPLGLNNFNFYSITSRDNSTVTSHAPAPAPGPAVITTMTTQYVSGFLNHKGCQNSRLARARPSLHQVLMQFPPRKGTLRAKGLSHEPMFGAQARKLRTNVVDIYIRRRMAKIDDAMRCL